MRLHSTEIKLFEQWLNGTTLSNRTIKNYLSGIQIALKHISHWDASSIGAYIRDVVFTSSRSKAMRQTATLRMYGRFMIEQGRAQENPANEISPEPFVQELRKARRGA